MITASVTHKPITTHGTHRPANRLGGASPDCAALTAIHWPPTYVLHRLPDAYFVPSESEKTVKMGVNSGPAVPSYRFLPRTREFDTLPLDTPTELPCTAEESGPLCDWATSIADVTKRFGPDVGGTADRQLEECGQSAPKPGDTQTCDHKVEAPMTLFASFGHMHMLGRSMKVELNPGTPEAKVLLDVPQFGFDNQRLVKLPSPVEIGPGGGHAAGDVHARRGAAQTAATAAQAAAALRGVGRRHRRRDVR
jgi:hypothetical protein